MNLARYHRQMLLPGIGEDGQRRLCESHALLVGCGALGTVIADAMVRAGVGTLTIVDRDVVEITNLQRQVLFDEAAIGTKKVDAALASARSLNSDVAIVPIATWLDSANARDLIVGHDLVIDASDNYASRLAVNDAAVALGIPFIHGAAIQWEGLVAGFDPRVGPCYRCLFPELPENEQTCSDVGVLGAVTGVIGSLMAVEALKHIIGSPDRLIDRLITYDARSGRFQSLGIKRSAECSLGHVLSTEY